MFSAAKTERGSKPQVEIAHALPVVDKLFGLEWRTGTFKSLDQDVRRIVAFERHVIGRLSGKIFGKGVLVFQNQTRIAGNRRHHLRHDYARGITPKRTAPF